jgi:hypothetical protein
MTGAGLATAVILALLLLCVWIASSRTVFAGLLLRSISLLMGRHIRSPREVSIGAIVLGGFLPSR